MNVGIGFIILALVLGFLVFRITHSLLKKNSEIRKARPLLDECESVIAKGDVAFAKFHELAQARAASKKAAD